jgi:hypothetical protein
MRSNLENGEKCRVNPASNSGCRCRSERCSLFHIQRLTVRTQCQWRAAMSPRQLAFGTCLCLI